MIPDGGVCLEIGVWKGTFTKQIVRKSNPSELHLVDPWIFTEEMKKYFDGQDDLDRVYEKVYERFGKRPNVFIHRCTSDEAVSGFSDEYFDWIYIDGDHSFEGVYSDLINYHSKVKKGGLIIGDDYGSKWIGVKKAVDKFCTERDIDFKVRKNQYWFEVK
jgi:hypothetical protein